MKDPVSVALAAVVAGSILLNGCRGVTPVSEALRMDDPQAHVEFARGLRLHYGFYADQAIAAFEHAASLTPRDPLPHIGLALALGPRTNDSDMTKRMERANKEAQVALGLSRQRSGLIKSFASAIASRYSASSSFDASALNHAYANAMGALATRYPDDDDVATLYAEALAIVADRPWWSPDGTPQKDIAEGTRVVERILTRNPRHVGANHYYVHFIEGTRTPERAVVSAKRLESLVPDVGHLLHMPSHIYMRLGDYQRAVSVNQMAMAADASPTGPHMHDGVDGMLVAHTREYLAAAAAFTGQSRLARSVDTGFFPLLRFERWDDILATPKVDGGVGEVEWRIAQVLALTARGRLREAREHRRAFTSLVATLDADTTWWADPIGKFLPMAEAEMDARLAWAAGDRVTSVRLWRKAVAAQDGLTRSEAVLPWFHPLRESLGAVLFLTNELNQAEQVFREDLQRTPHNPRSLFGLWHTLELQKRQSEAEEMRREFELQWREADVELMMTGL